MIQYTSALSYQTHKDALKKQKEMVYSLIASSGEDGISNHEIAHELGIPTATVSGLTRPLVLGSRVRQLKKRPCRVTGNTVIAWTAQPL